MHRRAADGVRDQPAFFNLIYRKNCTPTFELTSEQLQEDADILSERVHPDDLQRIRDSVHESFASMETWECDFRVLLSVRGERWIRGTANPEKIEDGVLWHGYFSDITDRKKAEERFNFALEGSNLGEWDWNYKTGKVIRSPRWAEMLGYSPEEIEPTIKKSAELLHPDDIQIVQNAVKEHLDGITDHYAIEYRLRMKNGRYKWIRDCGKIMERDRNGTPIRICGTHADIDKVKNSDTLVSESTHLLNSILDSSPDVIVFALDTNYKYLAFNSKHKEVIKNIWGKDISIGTSMLDVIGNHEDSRKAKENFDRALRGESFVVVEDYGDEELSRQSWLDYWSPIRGLDGTIIGLSCFLLNNTNQKIAQEKIESLLSEKGLILREVHHRIKNNFNTVSSLFSLQASTINEPGAILVLNDAANRIQSMSLLYDKLYRSTDYTKLSTKEYLSTLVDEIIANFPNSQKVKVEKDIQDFGMDVDRLQPLGIIIYELITNTMKYAFQGTDRGLISVSAVNTPGHVIISIQDDGIGIPDTVTFENSTGFGLQLVYALVQQLNGDIRIERGPGTKVILELDV